jgi:hypothetical protein
VIKFYTRRDGYDNEKTIYGHDSIVEHVGAPPTFVDNADGAVRSPSGFGFPPHSIPDQGQPLEAWLQQFKADFVTGMQARPLIRSSPGSQIEHFVRALCPQSSLASFGKLFPHLSERMRSYRCLGNC